jgi:uncharacterized protein involved in response to NO
VALEEMGKMYLVKTSLFAYGFRANFFLAGIAAVLLIPLWAVSFVAGTSLGSGWPPTLWHAHEMLFGFIAIAIAGFMLTAVPSWTGQKGFAGAPLIALAAVWVSARLLIASSSMWPPLLPAIVDLAFLPVLAVLVVIPLLRVKNRNAALLIVLGALWLTNLVFHIALIQHNEPRALHSLVVGIDIVLLLMTVIGGRIVPAFTSAALKQQGVEGGLKSRTALTVAAIAAMAGVIASDIFCADSAVAGVAAGFAALVQFLRLLQWRTLQTLRQPIVWILHLAYLWLPVGLALKAAALLGAYGIAAFWLHALTIGALTTMIMGVMTRAALGHTGRPLVIHPLTTAAYVLLTAAALLRVFGLSLWGSGYPLVIAWAAIFWTASFTLFLGVYMPILWGPRAYHKPG